MPTYEYICEKCGCEFEKFQSISARPLRKCNECGRMGLRRLIGAGAGIIFKGSGFYETDYRSKSYKEAQKNEKTETKETKTAAEAQKKDKKPAPKAKPEPQTKKN